MSTDVIARLSARSTPLDVNLCATNPDLIVSHLQARCDESNLKDHVFKLGELRASRNSEIVLSNEAKRKKHLLSNQIGRLISGRGSDITHTDTITDTNADNTVKENRCGDLKEEVEGLNTFIHETDKTIDILNEEIKQRFMLLPNLLHDRSVQSMYSVHYKRRISHLPLQCLH